MATDMTKVEEGDRFRCPTCGCEIVVTDAPTMDATQAFVDCCGHDMQRGVTGGG